MIKLKPKISDFQESNKFDLFNEAFLQKHKHNKNSIIEYYYNHFEKSKQNIYYELIGYLFELIGFSKCSITREGDTNNRMDALILESDYTIPIEIKSPTEIAYINIKSISQALENKIILTSRKLFVNNFNDTSLVVAHNYPNTRSEVNDLIEFYCNSYKINIGCLDFKSIFSIAYDVVVEKKQFDKDLIKNLKGFL
ncbi:hypothetical protein [Faecalibacter sp. LW9]|uniref:hypothetical protein n=1 Tax=Faecalibacter sp. LW9 TaxID=3103144 RepID=UPI002AFF7E15|nr:hypothetical protein [Faecalibacter sp. LW9]